jgi:hypothetical protein
MMKLKKKKKKKKKKRKYKPRKSGQALLSTQTAEVC